jgi:protein dithiol:quinone oxidoreductase
MKRARRFNFILAVISFGAVGFAIFTQMVWNMQPCPWCIVQRMLYLLIGASATVGLIFNQSPKSRFGSRMGWLSLGLAVSGLGLAIYQNRVAAFQTSCNFSVAEKFVMWTGLDELIPTLFQITASCADAAMNKLLGLPYELASACLFLALAFIAVQVVRKE